MRTAFWLFAGLWLTASCSRPDASSPGSAPAAQSSSQAASAASGGTDISATVQPSSAPEMETAVFSVPGIDDELVGKFAEALSGKEGLIGAQADKHNALFRVTFIPRQITGRQILELLQKVKPEIALQKAEGAAPGAGQQCTGCPYRNRCEKQP